MVLRLSQLRRSYLCTIRDVAADTADTTAKLSEEISAAHIPPCLVLTRLCCCYLWMFYLGMPITLTKISFLSLLLHLFLAKQTIWIQGFLLQRQELTGQQSWWTFSPAVHVCRAGYRGESQWQPKAGPHCIVEAEDWDSQCFQHCPVCWTWSISALAGRHWQHN